MNNKNKTSRPNNKRSKGCLLLHCFRPNHDDIDYDSFQTKPFDKGKTTDPAVVTYIGVPEKEGVVFPTVLSCYGEEGNNNNGSQRKKKMNIGLLRRDKKKTRTMVDETSSWAKKIINLRRKRNKDNKFKSCTSNLEKEGDKLPNTEHETTHQNNSNTSFSSQSSPAFTIPSSSSVSSSTTTTTIESSSPGTNARSSCCELKQPRQLAIMKQKQDAGYYYGSNMSMCLPLISLVTLILWGKFCAILCTSIGFFLVPPRRRRPGVTLFGDSKCDSVQYKKKKIMMEGLLERRRSSHN